MPTPSFPSTSPGESDESDDEGPAAGSLRLPPLLIGVLSLIAVGGIVDLILDRPTTLFSAHVIFEGSMVALSLGCIVVLWRGWRGTARDLARAQHSLVATQRSLEARQSERDAWRASAEEALSGLGAAIDRQFARWGLTPTEREVALLLLQGLGHKQVAARTARSERTVRQHAVSVYEKSGLGGRAELAAFFLQDLMLPRGDGRHDAPNPP